MPKLGGDDFAARFLADLEKNIDHQYKHLEEENDEKQKEKEKFRRIKHEYNQAYKRENWGDSNGQFLKKVAATAAAVGIGSFFLPFLPLAGLGGVTYLASNMIFPVEQ